MSEPLGLVRYDEMCRTIAACHSVDEVREIRAKARALEVYAKQAKNTETERQCSVIRLRAERKAGELLKEMKEDGSRARQGDGAPTEGRGARPSINGKQTLSDIGLTKDQSSKWQKLAKIPEERFEKAISDLKMPTTDGLLHNTRGTQGTGENEWYTPPEYIELARAVLGGIDLDPASTEQANRTVKAKKFYCAADNSIGQKWGGRVWMNPPYAQPHIAQFTEKLASEWESGCIQAAIALTHNYTDTAWFHRLAQSADAICFTRGRVKFVSPNGAVAAPTQGQTFFYFGQEAHQFSEHFSEHGFIVKRI